MERTCGTCGFWWDNRPSPAKGECCLQPVGMIVKGCFVDVAPGRPGCCCWLPKQAEEGIREIMGNPATPIEHAKDEFSVSDEIAKYGKTKKLDITEAFEEFLKPWIDKEIADFQATLEKPNILEINPEKEGAHCQAVFGRYKLPEIQQKAADYISKLIKEPTE